MSPELESPQFLRALLDNAVLFWKPYWGTVIRSAMYDVDDQARRTVRVGWLTYLSDPGTACVLPPSASWYPLADGIVVQAAEQPG